MRLGLLISAATLLATLALTACSGGEGPEVVEPASKTTIEATITATMDPPGEVVLPAIAATADAPEPAGEEEPAPTAAIEGPATAEEDFRATMRERWGRVMLRESEQRRWSESTLAAPALPMDEPSAIAAETLPDDLRPTPVPSVEFPDDIVLIASSYPRAGVGRGWGPQDLVRIYQRPGQGLVSETLFSPYTIDDPEVRYANYFYTYSTAEGSVLGASVCLEATSDPLGYGCFEADCCGGHIAHYESRDGGVTWERLAIPEGPWRLITFLPGDAEHPATRMLLNHDINGDYMLFPGGESVEPPHQHHRWETVFLADGRIAWSVGLLAEFFVTSDGEDVSRLAEGRERIRRPFGDEAINLRISDQLYFLPYSSPGATSYKAEDLLGGAAQSESSAFSGDHEILPGLYWPTIRDSETGEEWPIAFPEEVLRLGDSFILRLALHGPFLRVTGVDGCLPVRASHSPDAEELACAAERVLLTDLGGDVITDDGPTWRMVRTPAGIEGWADGRYLE